MTWMFAEIRQAGRFLVALVCLQAERLIFYYAVCLCACRFVCLLVDSSCNKYTTGDSSVLNDTILFLKKHISGTKNIQQLALLSLTIQFFSYRFSVAKNTTGGTSILNKDTILNDTCLMILA